MPNDQWKLSDFEEVLRNNFKDFGCKMVGFPFVSNLLMLVSG